MFEEAGKRLQRDGQHLRERFEAGMKRSQAMQRDVEQHIRYLRARQDILWGLRIELHKYLKDH
jgi:hypothetical protein